MRGVARRLPALIAAAALLPHASAAACPPAFATLRQDEDWSCLRDAGVARDALDDTMKYLPLPFGSGSYASYGGEARLRYDYVHHPVWGQDPQDPRGAFLQRYLLHADLHAGPHFRVFGQLRSAFEMGRAGGEPSPVEEGELAVQQLFADLDVAPQGDLGVTLRFGRQELRFGSERLVSVREGPNIRRRFDGARGRLRTRGWELNALAFFPAENEDGVFEDGTDTGQALWGAYAVSPELAGTGAHVDLYYLGFDDDDAEYAAGAGDETRHSFGTRLWGGKHGWDWNWEAIYQVGRFDGGDLSAWTVASDTGYTLEAWAWSPRLGLSANVASGDGDADDGTLETFNPLFPRGTYFDELGLLGPRNFVNLHPRLDLHPHADVTLSADVDFYWRLREADGVYDPTGRLLRAPAGSERYVSTLVSGAAEWQAHRRLLFTLVYTHVFPGEFVRDTGSHHDIDFVELTARFRF